jgi:hypothetical protein
MFIVNVNETRQQKRACSEIFSNGRGAKMKTIL